MAKNNLFHRNEPQTIHTNDGMELSSDGSTLIKYTGHDAIVNIPESVEKIGPGAFTHNLEVQQVSGVKVKEVDQFAFYDCKNLGHVYMPELTTVGPVAFANSGIESINLRSVETVDNSAFKRCQKLESVVFGTSVTEIGNGAFDGCGKLQRVEMPTHVDNQLTVGSQAFYGTSSLKEATLPSGTTEIGRDAYHNSGIERVYIPNTVKTIGQEAFRGTDHLPEIMIPASTESIGRYAVGDHYDGSQPTKNVILHESLMDKPGVAKDIAAMQNDAGSYMTQTVIPKEVAVTDLAKMGLAVLSTDGNEVLKVDERVTGKIIIDVENVHSGAFRESQASSIHVGPEARNIDAHAFINCENLKEVTMDPGLKTIGNSAFDKCDKIESIQVAPTVTDIGQSAFKCDQLREISIPMNASLGDNAVVSSNMERISIIDEEGSVRYKVAAKDKSLDNENANTATQDKEKSSSTEASLDKVHESYNAKDDKAADKVADKAASKDDGLEI